MQSKGGSGQMQGCGLLSAHFTFVFVAAEVVWLCCATFTLKGRSHTHTWRKGCCISCYKYSTNEKCPANPSDDRHLGAAVQTSAGWAMADLSLSILCQLNPMEHQEGLTQAIKAAPFLPWKLGMLHYGTCFSLTQRNIPGSNSNKKQCSQPTAEVRGVQLRGCFAIPSCTLCSVQSCSQSCLVSRAWLERNVKFPRSSDVNIHNVSATRKERRD